jgi:hypothetical protein
MRGVYEIPWGAASGGFTTMRLESGIGKRWGANRMPSSYTNDARRMSSPEESFPSCATARFSRCRNFDDVLEFVAHHKDSRSYINEGESSGKFLARNPLLISLYRSWSGGLEHAAKHQQRRTVIRPSSPSAIARVSEMVKCPSIQHVWCDKGKGDGSASIPKP